MNILYVGLKVPGEAYVSFGARQSFIDFDAVLVDMEEVTPEFYSAYGGQTYRGKRSFGEDSSFRLRDTFSRRAAESQTLLAAGKTLLLVLRPNTEFYVDTGDRQYSGTGRNARVTHIVAGMHTLDWLPVQLPPIVASTGTQLRRAAASEFDLYYREFQEHLYYDAYFEKSVGKPFLVTRGGNHAVGTVVRAGNGHVVFLPPVDVRIVPPPQEGKAAKGIIGERFNHVLGECVKALGHGELSPAPDWAAAYLVPGVLPLDAELQRLEEEMAALRQNFREVSSRKVGLESHRRLLYETGKPLEDAVICALELLGFSATRIEEGDVQYNVVFQSEEGRCLAEAEGRDSGPIGTDKMDQLERNIREEAQDKEEYAKGVLVANGFRFVRPEERGDQFTAKARAGAVRTRTALLTTCELYRAAIYFLENPEAEDVKRAARVAIFEAEGTDVTFSLPAGCQVPAQGPTNAPSPTRRRGGPSRRR